MEERSMQNGITRLFNAIWYTQVGCAIQQKELENENTENANESFTEDIEIKEGNLRYSRQTRNLLDNSEFWKEFSSQSNTTGIVVQKIIMDNPEAVRGVYEDIIQNKKDNIQRYKLAIGQLIALIEQKKSTLKGITDEIDKLEKMKAASTAKAENIGIDLKLSGLSEHEINQNTDYTRHINAFNDYESSIKEKNVRIDELEKDIERAQGDIESHKANITHLHRDVEKTKTEQSEAVAYLITAREKKEINGILSDIKVD